MTYTKQKRPSSSKAEETIGRRKKVLSGKGFVSLVDYLGTDMSVVRGARTSYGAINKTAEEDERLIRFLMRHKHTSPFEQVSFIFRIRIPHILAEELAKCRMAKYYISWPKTATALEFWRPKKISQEKIGLFEQQVTKLFSEAEHAGYDSKMLHSFLPGLVFVDMVWKVDLHNLCFFITHGLQQPIEGLSEYLQELLHCVQIVTPVCFEAFKDYLLEETRLTRTKCLDLKKRARPLESALIEQVAGEVGMSPGEVKEFLKKIQ